MSGRAAGYCAGYDMRGAGNPGYGFGFGAGCGRGRRAWSGRSIVAGHGWRNRFYATGRPGWMGPGANPAPGAPIGPEMERQDLEHQAEVLESELNGIRKRLAEMGTAPPAE